jgi:hypothetical protein
MEKELDDFKYLSIEEFAQKYCIILKPRSVSVSTIVASTLMKNLLNNLPEWFTKEKCTELCVYGRTEIKIG